jgi:uncharacterized protein YneR
MQVIRHLFNKAFIIENTGIWKECCYMEISISNQASEWFQTEMDLREGSFVRFFARYGGASPVQQGFSLGISTEEPEAEIGAKTGKSGITYYILEKDLWYFDGHNLGVEFNEEVGELEYQYK